jgi:hypothetical protein
MANQHPHHCESDQSVSARPRGERGPSVATELGRLQWVGAVKPYRVGPRPCVYGHRPMCIVMTTRDPMKNINGFDSVKPRHTHDTIRNHAKPLRYHYQKPQWFRIDTPT